MRALANSIVHALTPKGYEMRIHQYTLKQLEVLYDKKVELKNYHDNYNLRECLFATVSKDGSCIVTNFCKESICAYVQRDIGANKNEYRIGITAQHDLTRVLRMSNALHDVEIRFGFRMHSLKCYSLKNISSVDMWVFTLDPQWYNCPPVMSYLLEIIRSGLRGTTLATSAVLYKLLEERKPYEVFGINRKDNWGIGRNNTNYDSMFNPTYGMKAFSNDVACKSARLGAKFPNHDIFKKKK